MSDTLGPLMERNLLEVFGQRGDGITGLLLQRGSLELALLRHRAVPLGIPLLAAKRTCRNSAPRAGFDSLRTSHGTRRIVVWTSGLCKALRRTLGQGTDTP